MRVLVIDTYYPAVLARHYEGRPELAEASYAEQLSSLMALRFGTSDVYSRCFSRIGVEAADTIVNCYPLQRQWAKESGMRISALSRPSARAEGRLGELARLLPRIAAAQIEEFDPHVVYLQALNALPMKELRRQRAHGRLVVGQIASPLPPGRIVEHFDLILTSFPHFVSRIRRLGVDSEYLPIAFDTRVISDLASVGVDPNASSARCHDITFVGGVNPSVHGRGTAFLERLSERIELDVWGYGAETLAPGSPLLARHRGEAWGIDMYEVLADSKIAINRHIDVAENHSNNMRLFEATGVGALLMTELGKNLGQIFEPGEEVVPYEGLDDLIEKVRHYLSHDDERQRIAAAGQARTLKEHTYEKRILQLAEILQAKL